MLYSFIEWFVRKVLSPFLLFGWLAVTSPLILCLIWLRHSHEECARMLLMAWPALGLSLVSWGRVACHDHGPSHIRREAVVSHGCEIYP